LIEASQQGRVLHLALNRPEKRNALNSQICHALVEAFAQGNHDPSIGAILLSGNGPGFCAGMDVKEALELGDDQLIEIHDRLFTIINRSRKPILAAIHGSAMGGGIGLAVNAHIAIASPAAKFGLTEINLGLWPVMIFRAVALAIGERRATELSITGRIFTASEAQQYGLVAELAEDPLARARDLAAEVSAFSANALALGLDYSRRVTTLSHEEAKELGVRTRAQLTSHPDFAKGVKAFLERKRP
jgi:enoyl-CoA hydratase/carnithine racemase